MATAKMRILTSLLLLAISLQFEPRAQAAEGPKSQCGPWIEPAQSGGSGVSVILADIPLTARWADLPDGVKQQLQVHAGNRLAAFRARWGREGLAIKQDILLRCPTPEMSEAIDDYYRKSYDTVVPQTFSLKDIKDTGLSSALVRQYLGAMAAERASLTYPSQKLPNRDWDGKSLFDSVQLPDRETFADIKTFHSILVADLRAIDDAVLTPDERGLKREALFRARARAVGAFSGDSFGGSDMEVTCEVVSLSNNVVQGFNADKGRPRIFSSDDDVLREVNAMYLHSTKLKWVDVGTLAATKYPLCMGSDADLKKFVGDPTSNNLAKGIILLQNWWLERVSASADAARKCTVYSETDRAQLWEAFSADQRSNNDGTSSMVTYRAQLERYRSSKVAEYRSIAKFALQQVFPNDDVLVAQNRQRIIELIDAETGFGLFVEKIAAALDKAQATTNGPAAVAWRAAFDGNVERIGANYVEDERKVRAMYEEVKAWIAARYVGYPIEIAPLFSKFRFNVNRASGAETYGSTGDIEFGIGIVRSKMEYYSLLLHELRHAVGFALRATAPDKSRVASDVGAAVEGSGVAAEELLLRPFLKDVLKNDLAYALYSLDYGIRDARFIGTTDATLQKYFRSDCSADGGADTVAFTKQIAESYGLTGDKAEALAVRAHVGTQYFQYIAAGVQILDDISYLQKRIDPAMKRQIDPYVLFACGLNTPERTDAYADKLKACLRL
ncbi:hypothetical protein [Bradyrhizobium stylosanthis]|uniref:Uncharacterized protein n=1 Tax=Bradyrhizobium stylosanthis TaxID=1803665 RepID=A0A560E3J3_9BRAD|nr:hypothetical protein [Bradyrhizobium stylosanthis]TWB03843.1 hypothetical protein FBZ96_102316 [Bradyrhizobium stylosanthis]